jgi:hypothetical protein
MLARRGASGRRERARTLLTEMRATCDEMKVLKHVEMADALRKEAGARWVEYKIRAARSAKRAQAAPFSIFQGLFW